MQYLLNYQASKEAIIHRLETDRGRQYVAVDQTLYHMLFTHYVYTPWPARPPIQDDNERKWCEHAGEILHWGCGICIEHGCPVFLCEYCFPKACTKGLARIPVRECAA